MNVNLDLPTNTHPGILATKKYVISYHPQIMTTIVHNMLCYILLYDCLLIYENNVVINKNNTLIDNLKNQQFTTKTNHP